MKIMFQLFLFLSLLFSCNTQENREETLHEVTHNDLIIYQATGTVAPQESLKPPVTLSLETKPKPLAIEVPSKAGASYTKKENGKETKVELLPPDIRPAGFYYFMHNYTANDGLALDFVWSSMIDKEGNLWFGTNGGGVSRYDGHSFTSYPFAGNVIQSILQDKQGNLWFATEDGASRYDGESCITFNTNDGLANDFVRSIFEDKMGILWFCTNGGGVSKYDGKSFTTYNEAQGLANNSVWCIIEDHKGNLWFGTQGGASKYDGKSFSNYTKEQGLVNNSVHSILEDRNGNLWFGTEEGISKYDGSSFVNFTEKQGIANNYIWTAFEDKNGGLWFGTDSGGLSYYDGKTFTTYSKVNGLADNSIRNILEDRIGNLWFGTAGGGISKFEGEAFQNFRISQGLVDNDVRGILQDKQGILWFTTFGGVSRYDSKNFTNYTTSQGLPYNETRGVFEDKSGYLWFGTSGGGVSKFDGKSFTTYTTDQGLANNSVRSILQDKIGNLWFATFGGGISKFDGKVFTNYSTEQGLVNNYLRDILEDRHGNLWFSTDGGISKYDGKSFTNYTKQQGIEDNVMSIFEDKMGNLWISTFAGLIRYDGQSFMTYKTLQGLPENHTYRTIATQEEYLLTGTNKGIAILKEYVLKTSSPYSSNNNQGKLPAQNNLTNEELNDKYTPSFEIYNEKTGYPVADLNSGESSILIDNKEKIWFGTGSDKTGLVRFEYAALHKSDKPPNVVIQSIKINNEKISWFDLLDTKPINEAHTIPSNIANEIITFGRILSADERLAMRKKFGDIKFKNVTKFYYVPENLTLPHDHNNITFDFAAIEPNRPQNVLYQYKMEGYDEDWSPPSNETRAIYSNIFEGNYQLNIRAKNPYSDWSPPLAYAFQVLPPWYRTWPAYAIYALGSISIIYLIFLWRTAVLRQRYEKLQVLYRATERFVPKTFFNILNKEHIEDVKLGESTEVEVTAMFSDIRGYTSIMEKQSPQEAFAFINAYLKVMAPIIRAHEGFINSFMGDGIMALFPKSADDGITAVLAMKKALDAYNAEQSRLNQTTIKVGYGLNTGKAMIGIVGEEERMSANVIGDTINLASRIESLNKFYGTEFLASEGTVKSMAEKKRYATRLVDKVMVKGKKNPIYLYEVSFENSADTNKLTFNQIYEAAFRAYEKGDFQGAINQFKESLKHDPDNKSSLLFIKRCEGFLNMPIPEGWNGVYEMTQK